MPFTVSHAAAAAPIQWVARGRLVLSALVVGSMTPDVEYFLFLDTRRTLGHSLGGSVLMDIPMGLAMLAVWHLFLKRPFALLAPGGFAGRLTDFARRPFAWGPAERFAAICLSLWLGALSHIVWDSFTHWWGFFPRHYPILRETVFVVGENHVAVCRLLQYLSSLVGLAFLAWWGARGTLRLPARALAPAERLATGYKALAWCAVALLALWGGIANAVESGAPPTWGQWESRFIVRGIVGTVSAGVAASILVAALVHLRFARRGAALVGARTVGDER